MADMEKAKATVPVLEPNAAAFVLLLGVLSMLLQFATSWSRNVC